MEDNNKKDIFSDDSKFGEEKHEQPGKSFKSGFSSLGEGIISIIRGLWHIFSKKFHMNLFFLLVIIGAVIFGCYFTEFNKGTHSVDIIFPPDADTSLLELDSIETAIAENCISEGLTETLINISCPAAEITDCPECGNCSETECPECVCNATETLIIYYQCLDGNIVEDKSDCNELPMGLTTNDYNINNGILLALNNIEYEEEEDDYDGVITLINISVYNQANSYIKPKARVYLYKSWTEDETFKKTFDFDGKTIHPNAGITWAEESNIKFLEHQNTMRIVLLDTVPDPDEVIVSLTKNFDFS